MCVGDSSGRVAVYSQRDVVDRDQRQHVDVDNCGGSERSLLLVDGRCIMMMVHVIIIVGHQTVAAHARINTNVRIDIVHGIHVDVGRCIHLI